jgi:Ni,Fe-hydrogenase III small subunit
MINTISLMLRTGLLTQSVAAPDTPISTSEVHEDIIKILGRALCVRHVGAGSCNGCELELQALSNPYYNLEGLGVRFVASPRHADLLLVTGVVSVNMEQALKLTYDAMPEPKIVVAVGDCGCCGGMFGRSYASRGSIANVIPVTHTISGCPPSPTLILQGILNVLRVSTQR